MAHTGQALDFYTLSTTVDLTDPAALDFVIQMISFRSQPQITGQVYRDEDSFIFRFAVSAFTWDAVPNLLETIVLHGEPFGFDAENTVVTKSERI